MSVLKFKCKTCNKERLIYNESRLQKILQMEKDGIDVICRMCKKETKDIRMNEMVKNLNSEIVVVR